MITTVLLFELLLLLLAIPVLVFFFQVVCGVRQALVDKADVSGTPPKALSPSRVAVLVPAHNESVGVGVAIGSILPQLRAGDRLLVVADNCSDDTAAVARSLGAEVTERTNLTLRGKGYALAHGVSHLRQEPPDMVLVVDADCTLHPGSLETLVSRCQMVDRPVQACDLMLPAQGAPLKTKVAGFAWLVKNKIRPLGSLRLGWPCQLMGTGMIFPWDLIEHAPLASGHLAEDMQLGVAMAYTGHFPVYCDRALVTSCFPLDDSSLLAQRTRWESGHLSMIFSTGPAMLGMALKRRSWPVLGMALDMCVPPVSSLVMALCVLTLGAFVHAVFTANLIFLGQAAFLLFLVMAAVVLAWRHLGHAYLSGSELSSIPMYALSKLSIYVGFVLRRHVSWTRAGRNHEQK